MIFAQHHLNRQVGFTRVELLVVLSVIAVLVCLLIPTQRKPKTNSQQIKCSSNLIQIMLAANIFAKDYGGLYPLAVTNSISYQDTNSTWRHFMAISNELGLTKMLMCPADSERMKDAAVTFEKFRDGSLPSLEQQQNAALSYFIALRPHHEQSQTGQAIMFGDRNILIPGKSPSGPRLTLSQGDQIQWDSRLHNKVGNIAFTDGSVATIDSGKKNTEPSPTELLLPFVP
jgi:prepilin-type processing-associated H-X9-DG protein